MKIRESKYVHIARIAYRLAREKLPVYSHARSPHTYTFPQLAACVLLMDYARLGYRDMEEWLLASDIICKVLGLQQVPNYTTLCRAHKRLQPYRLAELEVTLAQRLEAAENQVVVDGSGLSERQIVVTPDHSAAKSVPAGVQRVMPWGPAPLL